MIKYHETYSRRRVFHGRLSKESIPLEVFDWNTAVASGGIPIEDSSHYQHLLPSQSLVMRAIRYYGIEGICLDNIPESQCWSVCIKLEPNYVHLPQ